MAVLAIAMAIAACDGTLDPNPVFSVTVAAPASTVRIGQTLQFTASVRDLNGVPVPGTVRWASLAPTIASVDSVSGLVTGVATGSATIRARASGIEGTLGVTVTP